MHIVMLLISGFIGTEFWMQNVCAYACLFVFNIKMYNIIEPYVPKYKSHNLLH